MNKFESLIQDVIEKDLNFIRSSTADIFQTLQKGHDFVRFVQEEVEKYKKSGGKHTLGLERWESLISRKSKQEPSETNSQNRNSIKENVEPIPKKKSTPQASSRSKRNAFKEATQMINQLSNISLNQKLRRPNTNDVSNVQIKSEKLSVGLIKNSSNGVPKEDVKVKTETEEMPAPTKLPPKKRRNRKGLNNRSSNSDKVQVKVERKDSDVIIQDVPVPTVEVSDGEDEKKAGQQEQQTGRMTRTKTRQEKQKRPRTLSSNDDAGTKSGKRSKCDTSHAAKQTAPAVDAPRANEVSGSQTSDTTFSVKKSPANSAAAPVLNATVVVENPKYTVSANGEPDKFPEDLMTDDESIEGRKEVPDKTFVKEKVKPSKQVFSPFERSPVKKKVAAFEKLHAETNSDIPPRMTRTKTRAQKKASDEDQTDSTGRGPIATPSAIPRTTVKEKAKLFTPVFQKGPKACSTTKTAKIHPASVSSNDSVLSMKSLSSLKASQVEFREREKRRREKEEEALRKRDALMQAQIEEKKRKREEKQLKAQQQREALEKEKLKVLEAQKLKEERHRQLLVEQEEKKQKQREEAERKRLMAKNKALEEKKREEKERMEAERRAEELNAKMAKQDEQMQKLMQKQKIHREHKLPVYMTIRAPLLPTDDCYDSDDDQYKRVRHPEQPRWATDKELRFTQLAMMYAGEKIKNTFFSCQATTPDLQEIFEVIDSRVLKRNSSAVWHKPPKFSILPPLHQRLDEDTEDDSD